MGRPMVGKGSYRTPGSRVGSWGIYEGPPGPTGHRLRVTGESWGSQDAWATRRTMGGGLMGVPGLKVVMGLSGLTLG